MSSSVKTGCLVVVIVAVLLVISTIGGCVGMYNATNSKYQSAQGAKSLYSAALNVVPQKIEGVWLLNSQYLSHESKVFRDYAAARSGILAAVEAFEKVKASGNESETVKFAQGVQQMLADFKKSSMLAVNVAIENNPTLRGAETTEKTMRTMEEGVNEVKTALDDWIVAIRNYNEYRGSFWPTVFAGMLSKFPEKIEYYEGEVKKLDIKSLNPAAATNAA